MFGLNSNNTYKPIFDQHYVLLYKIDSKELMVQITKDVATFEHFHEISIQKLRFHQFISEELSKNEF
jgi:hypothetical protein